MNLRWTGVADRVRGQIGDGTLKPGSRPSITRLCGELGVARKTAAKALLVLKDEGLLDRRPGIGYVVVEMPQPG